ncbi:glutathione S-transferase N-terminal domain-containing protein [Chondromyces crocatus]|uniref:GST N-terminal domain-containing protein n=1 Tax=Chondromyces crocatus TaxID=52 RepID=A0A0K1ECD4_CHOCO|nr:glutathione S-transferase N-terminal domain-containing protein [Chondromyces crocatus]AKT38530.1 uncharacterized protein CMC5_026770 [Chondromyces crocatus]
MSVAAEDLAKPVLVGRSSSHFTRVTRVFASETGVEHAFQVVRDLMSLDPEDYGGNPALKLPSLRTARGVWFGALNICRELSRMSRVGPQVVWPEQLVEPLLANAQELVAQAMTTEVTLILSRLAGRGEGNSHQVKMEKSLTHTLSWLDDNVEGVLAALPRERGLSYLEVTMFCLISHLEFRDVVPIAVYGRLNAFCRAFASRPSIQQTAYRFDS